MIRGVILVMCLLLLPVPSAEAASYTFEGDGGLTGRFSVGDTITQFDEYPWRFGRTEPGAMSGTFGLFTFTGLAHLEMLESICVEHFCDGIQGEWNVIAEITGPTVGNLTPQALNMFIFNPQGPIMSLDVPGIQPGASDFQFAFGWTNGSFVTGPMRSLTRVPEPPTVMLLAMALAILIVGWRYGRWTRPT